MGKGIVTKEKYAIAILIPMYNAINFLDGCLESILDQTFDHLHITLFDDNSSDKSLELARYFANRYPDKISVFANDGEQAWNGGARNKLMELCPDAEYVLFMDSDDRLVDNTVLSRMWDIVIENAVPDVVRLGYVKKFANHSTTVIINDSNPAEMAHNPRVAPWTKLVKKKLLEQVKFPENTLFEDVAHHIALSDIVETVVSTDFPVVEWNRCNPHSASAEISPKRKSSAFRFVADLMDLELTNEYAKERRDFKIRDAASNLGTNFDKIDWRKVCC